MLVHPAHDTQIGGASLWESTLDTLKVEALRSDPHTRYQASGERERVMKSLFLRHRDQYPQGKVLLRFGRNHLHRGLDARGISTLGNFVAEWALAHGQSVVNIGVFAAGGGSIWLDKPSTRTSVRMNRPLPFLQNSREVTLPFTILKTCAPSFMQSQLRNGRP